ncbi:MAG: MFS transporter [Myxococcota bacterium]|jgi:1-acyl-sn-glycerol-3-phosphate acyltransferase|nr:MFS transporter [Myxococcota bacterium]
MLALLRTRRFAPLFWTQLLGAFNDNLFKSALVVALTFGAFRDAALPIDALVNLATALLVLPFFLFGSLAGQLADRFDKATLARALKLAELVAMVVALVGFSLASLPLLFVALFLMGTQSAFFGPIKYALLPQHLKPEELVAGNAAVEAGTFVAILGGTLAGALIVAIPNVGVPLVGGAIVLVALVGVLTAKAIPAAPGSAHAKVDANLVRGTRELLRVARRDRAVWGAIVGLSVFWLGGAVILGQLPRLAEALGGAEDALTIMLAAFSFGIGAGSFIAERIARGRILVGSVPFALAAIGALTAWLPSAASVGSAAMLLFAIGVSGGLFAVPLMTLLQARAREDERARVIAANNVVNSLFMVLGAAYAAWRLSGGDVATTDVVVDAGVKGPLASLFLELGLFLVLASLVAFVATLRDAMHLLIAGLVRVMYRVDARGLDRVPSEGAALVVANHESFVDAFVLGGLCARPIRFVMDHRMTKMPGLGWLFRAARVIPIAPAKEDPELMARAFEEIDAALAAGEVVGLFPEGKCTRDGEVDVFRPGVERILAARPVPVVPVALDGLYGGFFSYANGVPMKTFPRRFWSRVRVRAGAPVELREASAIREAVLALFER